MVGPRLSLEPQPAPARSGRRHAGASCPVVCRLGPGKATRKSRRCWRTGWSSGRFGRSDVDDLFRLFGDRDLTRFWGHPALPDGDAARELLEEIEAGARTGRLLQWGIVSVERQGLIGTCTLAGIDPGHRRAELGAALDAGSRGAGHARRAARAVLCHGFDELGLHRVIGDVDPRNEPALRLAEDLGFTREGRLREHYRHDGEWQDGILFGLLSEESTPTDE